MLAHHQAAVEAITEKLGSREDTLGLLIGGSIAHGFAIPTSDVDIMIVVSAEAYRERAGRNQLLYFETESTPYEGGYVDGKYITADFIRTVAERGSEPARFAFKDAIVACSRIPELETLVRSAAAYPRAGKADRLRSFYGQLNAWHWYSTEALRLENEYLLTQAVSNLVLFAGRLVLTHNELLYPFHKWLLRVLEQAGDRPADLLDLIGAVVARRDADSVEALYRAVDGFTRWTDEPARDWGQRFMLDTELTWLNGRPAIGEV